MLFGLAKQGENALSDLLQIIFETLFFIAGIKLLRFGYVHLFKSLDAAVDLSWGLEKLVLFVNNNRFQLRRYRYKLNVKHLYGCVAVSNKNPRDKWLN